MALSATLKPDHWTLLEAFDDDEDGDEEWLGRTAADDDECGGGC